jgi:cell wall-associated NlpC family hydrolase
MADQFKSFMTNLGIKPSTMKRPGTGFNFSPQITQQGQPTMGEQMGERIGERAGLSQTAYSQNRQEQTSRVAQDVAGKSAFNIPVDEFGQVKKELFDLRPGFTKQLESTNQRGKLALQAEEAKNVWQQAKTMQDLGQFGFTGTITATGADIPGASPNNPGAKAVSLAMKAKQNGTPYVWGGNSLTKGIDCSGLVQQVYRQLGISVPRTTYEQAKFGKQVAINSLRPGDLVFYRPGSRGPEHVGIYMGEGKYVHAANSKLGVITSSLYGSSNGSPLMAIRPY